MNLTSRKIKVSVTVPESVIGKVDELVASGTYESRSAAFESAARKLLRERMDEFIEVEVLKLDRDAEMAEAEEGMADFAELVSE